MPKKQGEYTVKYRLSNFWFWRTLRHIVCDFKLDGSTRDSKGKPAPWPFAVRVFDDVDGNRFEIPMAGTEFIFSGERMEVIRRNMEEQSGLALPR